MTDQCCARCGREMPAPAEVADEIELTESQWEIVSYMVRRYKLVEPPTSPPSGLDMPEIIVPAAGFLVTDEIELICKGCAIQDELDDLDLADLQVAGAASEDDLQGRADG